MAKSDAPDDEVVERIIDVDVSAEMESSFLEYAYSVIYSRALPDARDGLKPVQRRILYSMDDMGIRPDRGHVKSARVVGEVMGKLHPHGDSAIYDALVRTAQPWSMRLPLIDGHGNFGSLDAGPAAMRYTECRMATAAAAMTAGLDEDTVDFRANYDGKETEPVVLPAAFPNLLVNGTTGIAVGMATNIPPHNLVEVVQALKHLIAHPEAELDDLIRYIPGPDLPTGGTIVGLDGVKDAYATGRGTFRIRATSRVEQFGRRQGLVITELPYMVGPEKIIEQIKTLVQAKKLTGIADVKDLTDLTHGTQLVIEVKNGINPTALLEQLYRQTKLEDSFGINAVALVDGQPRTLTLKDMLEVYLSHRLEVTRRRTQFQLGKAQDRLHLVQGLLLAIVDIDDVIAIIRSSDDVAEARTRLIEAFELSEIQANHILDMQLRQLTRLSSIRLEAERDELVNRIAALMRILDDESVLRTVVSDDLDAVAKEFGTPRRTVLLEGSGAVARSSSTPLELADDPCWVMLSSTGLVARLDQADLPSTTGPRGRHDVVVSAVAVSVHSEFGVITSAGRLVKARALELPTVPVTANAPHLRGGLRLSELVTLEKGERPLALTTLSPDSLGLAVGTRKGVVKRVNPEVLNRDSWEIIRLDPSDELVGAAEVTSEDSELVFVTGQGQLLHFSASLVRPQGRAGGGVAGIKLAADDAVVWFGTAPLVGSQVVTISGTSTAPAATQTGSVKITPLDEYPAKGRATAGVRAHRFLRGEDLVLTAWVGSAPVVAAASSGSQVELPPATGKRDGSGVPVSQPIAGIGTRQFASRDLPGEAPPDEPEDEPAVDLPEVDADPDDSPSEDDETLF